MSSEFSHIASLSVLTPFYFPFSCFNHLMCLEREQTWTTLPPCWSPLARASLLLSVLRGHSPCSKSCVHTWPRTPTQCVLHSSASLAISGEDVCLFVCFLFPVHHGLILFFFFVKFSLKIIGLSSKIIMKLDITARSCCYKISEYLLWISVLTVDQ